MSTSSPVEHVRCPRCGELFPPTKTGKIRKHTRRVSTGQSGIPQWGPCAGNGGMRLGL